LARTSPMHAWAMHADLLLLLGSCLAYACTCSACILTPMAGLVPRRCVHVLCMYSYSYDLARASPGCARAMHVYLLVLLRSCFACVCTCHACIVLPWLGTSPAIASPVCESAMHVYLLVLLRSCFACVCTCHACILAFGAWLVPCLCMHAPCMYTYSCGLAGASPVCELAIMHTYSHGLALASLLYALAVHIYLLLWACILTLMAWLSPRRCMHVLCMHTDTYCLACTSPMYACEMHAYLLLWL
jgi:hypothetical protein